MINLFLIMERLRSCILFITLLFGLPTFGYAQKAKIVKWNEVQELLAASTDSLTVINLWATWCKPCVKELPHFEQARAQFKDKPVRFRYISLDFASDKSARLDPFIKKKLPGAHVWLLDETDYNTWIEKFDITWGGAIPVTLFLNNAKKFRIFAPTELTFEQLVQNISSSL